MKVRGDRRAATWYLMCYFLRYRRVDMFIDCEVKAIGKEEIEEVREVHGRGRSKDQERIDSEFGLGNSISLREIRYKSFKCIKNYHHHSS